MIPIIRTEKINQFDKLLSNTDRKGSLCYLLGPAGMGKSSFLESLKEHLKNDESITCVLQEIRQVATTTFFFNLMEDLERETDPTKNKVKKFFSDHKKFFTGAAKVVGTVTGTREIVDLATELATSQDKAQENTMIQDEFIKILTKFTEEFPDNKIVILVDEIDSNLDKALFIAMFNDLRKRLPKNVIILLASTKKEAESDNHITLDNFNHEEIHQFMKLNFENVDESIIKDVEDKTAGFPESLFWLFEASQREKQGISQLLLRMPREGFMENIQERCLEKLSEQEIAILKICSILSVIDRVTIATVLEVDQLKVKIILKDFQNNGMITLVNSMTMADSQIIDIFLIQKTYSKGITSIYGAQNEIKLKIINYFANEIINSDNPLMTTQAINRLVELYMRPTGGVSPKLTGLFELVEQKPDKKCSLLIKIYFHFLEQLKSDETAELIKIFPALIQDLTDKHSIDAYNKFCELSELLSNHDINLEELKKSKELQNQRKKQCMEKANELENIIVQDSTNEDFKIIKYFVDMVKMGISQAENSSELVEPDGTLTKESINKILDFSVKQQLEHPENKLTNENAVRLIQAFAAGSQAIQHKMGKVASIYFEISTEYCNLFTENEKNELDRTLRDMNNPVDFAQLEDELAYGTEHAKFLELIFEIENKSNSEIDEDEERIIKTVEELVNKLKQWEDHPIRGEIYRMSKDLLKDITTS